MHNLFSLLFLLTLNLPAFLPQDVKPKPFSLPKQRSLEGVKQMVVSILFADDEAEKNGITYQKIKDDVELKLRQSKVPCTMWDLFQKSYPVFDEPGFPRLMIGVTFANNDTTYAYLVHLYFIQNATLQRNPNISMPVTTYSLEESGLVGISRVASVRDTIKDMVDKFCIEYLKENEKK